nr:hypothetical protein [Natronomonas sp. CBA1123]
MGAVLLQAVDERSMADPLDYVAVDDEEGRCIADPTLLEAILHFDISVAGGEFSVLVDGYVVETAFDESVRLIRVTRGVTAGVVALGLRHAGRQSGTD